MVLDEVIDEVMVDETRNARQPHGINYNES